MGSSSLVSPVSAVVGAVHCNDVLACGRFLGGQRGGSVVNISTHAVRQAELGLGVYSGTQTVTESFTRT